MKQTVIWLKKLAAYREQRCVLNIRDLKINQGELVAVVGPNGAGKSTLLQVANLLIPYQQGELWLFGECASKTDVLAVRRRCAMVLQEALFLKGSVFDNVALGLKFRGCPPSTVHEKITAALKIFQCSHLAGRSAARLSGGEAQRVSLARALVTNPELLYLDEPFASLDFATRTMLLTELRQIAVERGMTVILVSHQFSDILYFADRAIVLENGMVVQDDIPERVLRQPANKTVAALVGMDNILDCQVTQGLNGQVVTLKGGIMFTLPDSLGRRATACCLPGDAIRLWDERLAYQHVPWVVLTGVIEQIVPGIGVSRVIVTVNGLKFSAQIPRGELTEQVQLGRTTKIAFDPQEAHFI